MKLWLKEEELELEEHKNYKDIMMSFHKFGKENGWFVVYENYVFNSKQTLFKKYNKNKTGIIILDMKGKIREELFKKPIEEFKIIDGHEYQLNEKIPYGETPKSTQLDINKNLETAEWFQKEIDKNERKIKTLKEALGIKTDENTHNKTIK